MEISPLGRRTLTWSPDPAATHPTVLQVQKALNLLAKKKVLAETGLFDAVTREALRVFQEQVGLPATGVIDQATIDALNRAMAGQEPGVTGTRDTFERVDRPTPFARALEGELRPYVQPFIDAQDRVMDGWDKIQDKFLRPMLQVGQHLLDELTHQAARAHRDAQACKQQIRGVLATLKREDVPEGVKDVLRSQVYELHQKYRMRKTEADAITRDIARFSKRLGKAREIFQRVQKGVDVTSEIAELAESFLEQYESSTAQTKLGRAIDAALYTGIRYVMGRRPVVSALDTAMGQALGEENSVSNIMSASVRATVTVLEAIQTGETEGLEAFQEGARSGKFGTPFKWAAQAGEYYSEHGFFKSIHEALRIKDWKYLKDDLFLDLRVADGGDAGAY